MEYSLWNLCAMVLLLVLFALALAVYWYGTRHHDYWAKRNVKHDAPVCFFGNNYLGYIGKKSVTEISLELYGKYPNEKVVGYYRGTTPELYIRDPDLVRTILKTDFRDFHRRGLGSDPEFEPLLQNLFHAEGDRWKLARQRLVPAFRPERVHAMYPLMVRCAETLQQKAVDTAQRGEPCDVWDLMARFTIQFIGECGFGVDTDSFNYDHYAFSEIRKLIFARPKGSIFKFLLWDLFPILRSFTRVSDIRVEESMMRFVKWIRKERQFWPSGRNDFIDLLLELERMGTIRGRSIEHFRNDGLPEDAELDMDIKMMAAQVFMFFAAGFETLRGTMSYTLHELAYNPEYQRKIQNEIDAVLLKYDNKLCCDAVAEMHLLRMALKESMRLFPSVGVLTRVCVRRYSFPGLNMAIDPGVKIVIPVQALQTDAAYFENPLEFRPERFSPGEAEKHHKHPYLPFGYGPRSCIGSRLGEMQSLAGLAALLRRCSVAPAPATRRRPARDPRANITQAVQGGLPLILTLRQADK